MLICKELSQSLSKIISQYYAFRYGGRGREQEVLHRHLISPPVHLHLSPQTVRCISQVPMVRPSNPCESSPSYPYARQPPPTLLSWGLQHPNHLPVPLSPHPFKQILQANSETILQAAIHTHPPLLWLPLNHSISRELPSHPEASLFWGGSSTDELTPFHPS